MHTTPLQTDYLIVGSGAVGMAFADTLFHETSATMVIVDQHHGPGGHWNDAYPFVRLHQPSAFYGVNSRALGGDGRDTDPLNQGMCERASAAQILDYYQQLMGQFVASGRVRYFPMSSYDFAASAAEPAVHRFSPLMGGDSTELQVNKRVVDTTHLHTAVPSTHPPKYAVAPGLLCMPLNDLPQVKQPQAGFVVVGAGKTGIDACLWLLQNGVPHDDICWIMPRDSWFQNRANVQPGAAFFMQTFGALATQMESILEAESVADLFVKLEARDQLLRLDPHVQPGMYHAAVVSHAELAELRKIKNVVRLGRVQRFEADQIVLEKGLVPHHPQRIIVDCSASAAELRPPVPVFQSRTITPQFVRAFQPTFSAAFIAHVEATYSDDAVKNQLCGVVPLPDAPITWLTLQGANMRNAFVWSQDKSIGQWQAQSRLDGLASLSRGVAPNETEKKELLMRFRTALLAAAQKVPQLLAQAATS